MKMKLKKIRSDSSLINRKSTGFLNDERKAVAKQISENIKKKKKSETKKHRDNISNQIKDIRSQLKGLPRNSPKREAIKNDILKLRESNKAFREKIIKDFDEEYLKELDKLRANKTYTE